MLKFFTNSRYKINRKNIAGYIAATFEIQKIIDQNNINVIFVGKRKMLDIANEYKKENEALPVLTFSYLNDKSQEEDDVIIGEIFICYPQAVLLAAERNKIVDKMMAELIVHGINNVYK